MAVKTASRRLCDAVHDWRSSREGLHLCRMMQARVSLTHEQGLSAYACSSFIDGYGIRHGRWLSGMVKPVANADE